MKLDERELASVLAGLRLLQGWKDGDFRVVESDQAGYRQLDGIDNIAMCGSKYEALDDDELDALCVRLNTRRTE